MCFLFIILKDSTMYHRNVRPEKKVFIDFFNPLRIIATIVWGSFTGLLYRLGLISI